MLVYLAGSITWYHVNNCLEDCLKWRRQLTYALENINIKVFNPCISYNENLRYSGQSVVKQNSHYLRECSHLIVHGDHLLDSPGSIFEMTTMYLANKPIIAFGYNEYEKYPHLKFMVDQHLNNIDEVVDYMNNLYYL